MIRYWFWRIFEPIVWRAARAWCLTFGHDWHDFGGVELCRRTHCRGREDARRLKR